MENNQSSPLFCWTILYPYKEGTSFDLEHYSKVLIPEYVKILGENCVRYEVRKGLATPGAAAPNFLCVVNIWITSREQFRASMGDEKMKILLGKIAALTDIQPLRQLDEVT